MLGKSRPQLQSWARSGGEGNRCVQDGVHRALIILGMFSFLIWMGECMAIYSSL